MPRCASCGQVNPENARFCFACGAGFDGRQTSARKNVTILFADVTGSTALAEQLDPELVRSLMTRYFEAVEGVVAHHGGRVEKFAGDAAMAVFGIPIAREDDALRAVRAAVAIRDAVADVGTDVGVPLKVHAGLNTGEIVTGETGAGPVVIGDAVNVAARLEETARPGEILISNTTFRLVRDSVIADPLAPLSLKGKSERVHAVRLIEILAGRREGRAESALIGRETELTALHGAFDSAVDKRRTAHVTVIGEAGIGKSRLVRDFLCSLTERAVSLTGRCLPYGEGITFWPVNELVAQAAGLSGDDPLEASRTKIRALLSDEDADTVADRLAAMIVSTESDLGLDEQFWAVRRLVETLARRSPLIVVFDDIQWAEPSFLELIRYLRRAHDAPLLVICLARPELLDAPEGAATLGQVLPLSPLAEDEAQQLIGNLLAGGSLPGALRAEIAETSDGNPLFVEELVQAIAEQPGGAAVVMPATIQAVLAARLDSLEAREREVLAAASVEGQVFHRGALEHLVGDVAGPVGSLERRELIRAERASFADEDAFRFHHLLLREVAYEAISKAERAELHQRFATWLESKAGVRARDYDEIIGYHLETAHVYRVELGDVRGDIAPQAAERLAYAGLRAHARGDMPAAASLLSRALQLMGPDHPLRAELSEKREEALREAGVVTTSRRSSIRCFWSRPLGHRWVAASRHGQIVIRCVDCRKERRVPRSGPPASGRPVGESDAALAPFGVSGGTGGM